MADGRFGCEADMARPAVGSTRSLVTHTAHFQWDFVAMQHGRRAAKLRNRDPDHFSDLEIELKRSRLVANSYCSSDKVFLLSRGSEIDIVPVCGSPG